MKKSLVYEIEQAQPANLVSINNKNSRLNFIERSAYKKRGSSFSAGADFYGLDSPPKKIPVAATLQHSSATQLIYK